MKAIKTILVLLLVVVLLVFALQNGGELTQPVSFQLNLYLWDFSPGPVPVYGIILSSFFAGLLISGAFGWAHRLRLRGECKRANRLLLEKDKELNSLRNLPVLESETSAEKESAPGEA